MEYYLLFLYRNNHQGLLLARKLFIRLECFIYVDNHATPKYNIANGRCFAVKNIILHLSAFRNNSDSYPEEFIFACSATLVTEAVARDPNGLWLTRGEGNSDWKANRPTVTEAGWQTSKWPCWQAMKQSRKHSWSHWQPRQ